MFFKTNTYKHAAYKESFVQVALRIMRDGKRDLYTTSTSSTIVNQKAVRPFITPPAPAIAQPTKALLKFPTCSKECKGEVEMTRIKRDYNKQYQINQIIS